MTPVAVRWRYLRQGGESGPWAYGGTELLANKAMLTEQAAGRLELQPLYVCPVMTAVQEEPRQ